PSSTEVDSEGDRLTMLPGDSSRGSTPTLDMVRAQGSSTEETGDLRARLQRYEMQIILDALRATRWNQTEAARQLGMPLRTLVHKISALGINTMDRYAQI